MADISVPVRPMVDEPEIILRYAPGQGMTVTVSGRVILAHVELQVTEYSVKANGELGPLVREHRFLGRSEV